MILQIQPADGWNSCRSSTVCVKTDKNSFHLKRTFLFFHLPPSSAGAELNGVNFPPKLKSSGKNAVNIKLNDNRMIARRRNRTKGMKIASTQPREEAVCSGEDAPIRTWENWGRFFGIAWER